MRALFVLAILLMTLGLGCHSEKDSHGMAMQDLPMDSILIWIELAKDKNIPIDFRKKSVDKAHDAIKKISNDTLRTKYFSKLSLAYLQVKDSIQFRSVNRMVLNLGQQVNDSTALADAHWDLADMFNSELVLDSAYYHFSQASKLYEALDNDFSSARMLYNMAVIQADVKDYTGSEINTIRAIELLKPLEKNLQLFLCYNNLGSITKELEEFDRALEYYEQAEVYQKRIEDPNNYFLSLQNNKGIVYQEMGEHSKAVAYFEKVISDPELETNNPKLYARALNNWAHSRHKLNKTEDLTATFKKAVHLLDSIQDWQGISRGHYNGAEYYKDIKDTTHALIHANLALEFAIQSKNNKRMLETMELLANLDPVNAIAYTKSYIKLDDSLQQEERAIRNKFARIRFETDEFIAQNELLARQRQLWIGVAGGVFLLAFSVFIIIVQRVKNQRLKFQQQQQESNQEIFNLMLAQNQKLEEGKQYEQKRISEELHDGVLGEMNGVRMVLLGLNKKADEAAVSLRAQAIAKLQQIQEEIRTISHELSDASYRKFHNFVISLEELLKSMTDASGLRHELTYDEDIDWDALKGEVKINLYRIIQESLQNSIKHANASTLSLDLHGNSKFLEVTIKDDGKGFHTQHGKKGIGHKNISSRVKKIKGKWDISSKVGKGTTVKIRVPYEEAGIDTRLKNSNKNSLQEA